MARQYWLMKSEPESYSIEQFAREKTTLWTGVRNYQARNFMTKGMKTGDLFFFYHSNAEPPSVVGIGQIVDTNIVDPTAFDKKSEYYDEKSKKESPRWFCAKVEFKQKLKTPVSLSTIKKEKGLEKMLLLQRGQRLSIQPVQENEFQKILRLSEGALNA